MFTSSKSAAICLAVTVLFNDVNAEAEVTQTFGLLGSRYRAPSNTGPYGAPHNVGPYGPPRNARPYGAPSAGIYGGVGASAGPAQQRAGHGGVGVLGWGTGARNNAYGGTSVGGVIGIGGPAGGRVNHNAYGGVGGAVQPRLSATNGAWRPVGGGAPRGTAGAGTVVNTSPYGSVGEITRPGVGNPANVGTSGISVDVTEDKKDNNGDGGVNGATNSGAVGTKGAEKPVTDEKVVSTVTAGDKNAVPVVAADGVVVSEAGRPENEGTSGNDAYDVADDEKDNNTGVEVNGATDTGAAGTKGAEKPATDVKDVPTVVAGDKNAVPVVAAGGAVVPEAGKPANGSTSGIGAGANGDKKDNNAYGGVNGATDTGAAGTKGAGNPVMSGKDRTIVIGVDGKPCTDGAGGAIGSAVKPTSMKNVNTVTSEPFKSSAKTSAEPTTVTPNNGRVGAGGAMRRAYRKLRWL